MTRYCDVNGIRFARIEPGEVWIGNAQDTAYDEALRPFCVRLTRPFWISVLPVTQGLWHAVMGEKFHRLWKTRLESAIADDAFTWEKLGVGPDYPMYSVNYEEALAFVAKYSHITGKAIRLPTEAEWERAAQSTYGFDNTEGKGIALTEQMGWFNEGTAASRMMKPVGQRPGGGIAVSDMYGLVWEFVRGRYRSNSGEDFDNGLWPECYPASGSTVNDFEPTCTSPNLCVAKGGSIYSEASELASSQRLARAFAYFTIDLGFRLALDDGDT